MTDEYRNFEGEIRNLVKQNDFIYEVELWLLNNLVNRNGWQYTDMSGNKDQFAGTPILIAYVNNGSTIGAGHEFRMEYDSEGNEAPTFTGAGHERIIGMISENKNDIRIQTLEDGTEWIVAKGFIWKWYAKEAVEKVERDTQSGRPMSLSIETLVTKSHMNEENVEVEDEYVVLGTTLLGDGVMPAVADAHIKALQEIESEFKELKLRAASYIGSDEEEKEEEEELVMNEETKNEPQQKTSERNEKTSMNIFSKKQLAELSPKFEGYTVLSAGQDETGIHVCLMSATGDTAVYNMEGLEDVIDPKKIARVNTKANFVTDSWEMDVEVEAITDNLSAALTTRNSELEVAQNELQTAKDTIASMTEKELKRRVSAAKAKAQSTLDAFNANREEKIDASILNKINECIDNGDFSECENAEGEWCGEEEVCNQVLAACAKEVMELDKKANLARNSQYIWDGMNKANKAGNGDVADLLAQFNIQ